VPGLAVAICSVGYGEAGGFGVTGGVRIVVGIAAGRHSGEAVQVRDTSAELCIADVQVEVDSEQELELQDLEFKNGNTSDFGPTRKWSNKFLKKLGS